MNMHEGKDKQIRLNMVFLYTGLRIFTMCSNFLYASVVFTHLQNVHSKFMIKFNFAHI